MNDWKLLAIFTPFLFVTYQTISKFLPKEAPIFLVNAIASLIGALIMFLFHLLFSARTQALPVKLLPFVVDIGALISIGNFLIIKASSLGAALSTFTSLYPLLIAYGVLYGIVLWHERLSPIQFMGLGLITTGLIQVTYFKK